MQLPGLMGSGLLLRNGVHPESRTRLPEPAKRGGGFLLGKCAMHWLLQLWRKPKGRRMVPPDGRHILQTNFPSIRQAETEGLVRARSKSYHELHVHGEVAQVEDVNIPSAQARKRA